ncbi:MAG TPA: hypothetical protein VF462_02015 [Micromonosporaceae bacterium]
MEREPREVMVVHSARFPRDLSRLLEEEATRRGTNPSALMRQLVEQALAPPAGEPDEPVMIRPSEIRRTVDAALDAALRRSAA